MANNYVWSDKFSKYGFWILTIGTLLYAVPTYIIGIHQAQVAMESGYFFARTRDAIEGLKFWMWVRLVPDGLMIIGGGFIFYDLVQKTFFAKKIKAE